MPPLSTLLRTGVAMAAVLSGIARAADDPRIDAQTGRDQANYPPDRHFDHLHMRLEIDIPDMTAPKLSAVETLTVTPMGRERDRLELDAGRFSIQSLTVDGRVQTYTHDRGKLAVQLSPPVRLGQRAQLRIAYTVEYPRGDGTGLTWTAGRENARSITDQAAQIHSQGQPDYNSTWFACQDFPNEMATTELIVTVEDPYVVGSNGHLVATRYAGRREGRTYTTWHWLQDKPHCAYLVSMVVGRFAIVGLPAGDTPPLGANGRRVECYLYGPLGDEATAQKAYAKTPAMVAHFNTRFAQPYPWDKYSQALVRRFRAGGMENTSATTMQSSSARSRPGSQDEVIAHELAHQWFGDLVTCKGWEHGWLNEGWASFAEALWAEADSKSRTPQQAYQRVISSFMGTQRGLNRTYAPDFPALVSNRYSDAMEPFMKPDDIYSKGALVLHMLRMRLGDEAFWRGVHAYVQRHKFGCVETDDFRHALEEASGLSLERFFTQWCMRPGIPRLTVGLEWKEGSGEGGGALSVVVDQTQHIDGANPAYAFTLPILVKSAGGNEYRHIDVDVRHAEAEFRLAARPDDVVVDPGLTVAAVNKVTKALSMWLRQIDEESVFAQLQAVEHLALFEDSRARLALVLAAADVSRVDRVRAAAGRALADRSRRLMEQLLGEPPPLSEPRAPTLAAQGGTR